MTDTEAPATSDARRALAMRAWRLYSRIVREWTNTSTRVPEARHGIRTQRLRSTWPQLAIALDQLAESVQEIRLGDRSPCPHPGCGVPVDAVKARPNPRTAEHTYTLWPCGDEATREQALACWEGGADADVTPINGATLGAAERARQRTEEGFTIEHDLEHDPGELAWAAWCLIDASAPDAGDTEQVPAMWPWPAESWRPGHSRLRRLIIAEALIQAEIDTALSRGERP